MYSHILPVIFLKIISTCLLFFSQETVNDVEGSFSLLRKLIIICIKIFLQNCRNVKKKMLPFLHQWLIHVVHNHSANQIAAFASMYWYNSTYTGLSPVIKLLTSNICCLPEEKKYMYVGDYVLIFSGVHRKFLSSASFPIHLTCGLLESLFWSYFHMEWNLGQD